MWGKMLKEENLLKRETGTKVATQIGIYMVDVICECCSDIFYFLTSIQLFPFVTRLILYCSS